MSQCYFILVIMLSEKLRLRTSTITLEFRMLDENIDMCIIDDSIDI